VQTHLLNHSRLQKNCCYDDVYDVLSSCCSSLLLILVAQKNRLYLNYRLKSGFPLVFQKKLNHVVMIGVFEIYFLKPALIAPHFGLFVHWRFQ
jgi:hypothetical protein